MTEKAKKVVKGFTELTEDDRKEVLEFLKKYMQGDYFEKFKMFNNLNESRTVGVTSQNSCPCCGK